MLAIGREREGDDRPNHVAVSYQYIVLAERERERKRRIALLLNVYLMKRTTTMKEGG